MQCSYTLARKSARSCVKNCRAVSDKRYWSHPKQPHCRIFFLLHMKIILTCLSAPISRVRITTSFSFHRLCQCSIYFKLFFFRRIGFFPKYSISLQNSWIPSAPFSIAVFSPFKSPIFAHNKTFFPSNVLLYLFFQFPESFLLRLLFLPAFFHTGLMLTGCTDGVKCQQLLSARLRIPCFHPTAHLL